MNTKRGKYIKETARAIKEHEFNNPKFHLSFLMPATSTFNLLSPTDKEIIYHVKLRKLPESQSAYVSKYANDDCFLEISCDLDSTPLSENKVRLDNTSNTTLVIEKYRSEVVQVSLLSNVEIQATFISDENQKIVVQNNLLTMSEGDL